MLGTVKPTTIAYKYGNILMALITAFCICGTVGFAFDASKLKMALSADSLVSIKYSEYSKLESTGSTATINSTPITGSQFEFSGTYEEYGFFIGHRAFGITTLDYFTSRKETIFAFTYRHATTPWLSPSLGFYSSKQIGELDTADAPAAFVESNEAFTLGLGMNFDIYTFETTHSIVFAGKVNYLTTFEKSRNFGNEYQASIGYGYNKDSLQLGIVSGYLHQMFRAEKVEEASPSYLVVRSLFEGVTIGVYVRR